MIKTYATHFCGVGGACLGLEQSGLECRLAIDYWEPATVYREKNLGHKAMHMDIAEYEPHEEHKADLLWTSPPCQTFSSCAREQSRMNPDDIRDFLFLASIKYCQIFKPQYFVFENVMGVITHEADGIGDGTLTQMRKSFMELGYHVEWNVLNSKYWLPQDRERVIMIGSLAGKKGLIPREPRAKVGPKGEELPRFLFGEIMEKQNHHTAWGRTTYGTAFDKVARGAAKMKIITEDDILPTVTCGWGGGATRKKVAVLDETNPLTAMGGIAFLRHPSVIEGARAQGFPDSWVWPDSWTDAWQMIGNAVSPPVARAVGKHLIAIDSGKRPASKAKLKAKRLARYANEILDSLPPDMGFEEE